MIKQKQIQGLEELNDESFVKASVNDNETVSLVKSNGFSLSFSLDNIIGDKGDEGAAGEKGEDGLSVYALAVLQGYQGSEINWLNSLKGEKGKKGMSGRNGVNGKNGHTISFKENVTVLVDDTPSFSCDSEGTVTLVLPDIRQGQQGTQGQRYRTRKCLICEGDVFDVNMSWESYSGVLNITLPSSQQGLKGDKGITVNGKSPFLESVKISRNLIEGSSWQCFSNGLKNNVYYDFELCAPPKGLKGERGKDGLPGAVTNSLTAVKETERPPENYVAFIPKREGAFSFFNFGQKHSVLGFGLYNNKLTFVDAESWDLP